jgi:hypothetical protein
MNLQKKYTCVLLVIIFCSTYTIKAQQKENTLHGLNTLLVNTVMEDLFTPTVASRIYVYPNIAFYECIRLDEPSLPSFVGKLNDKLVLPSAPPNILSSHFISACISFTYVAQSLVGTEYKIENWRNKFIDSLLKEADSIKSKRAIEYGRQVADSMIQWIKNDNYLKSRAMMRYVITNKPGDWQPTPQDYAQGLEPHWNTIRPLTLKSASQFSPKEKLIFSKNKKSIFYKTMLETYWISKKLDTTQKATALYWDDNPNVSVTMGHLNYFVHKISPGGHWLMIAKQACEQKQIAVVKSAQIYALTTIGIFDGFISCWDEKYRSNLVRPITIINRTLDKNWVPYIQTPPFPEFTSGHSVVSNAAATILTALLGDNFIFTDKTEIPFGQGTRMFNSFYEAALQSSNSRVYGGIHYPETARISVQQGKTVGQHVLNILYFTKTIK